MQYLLTLNKLVTSPSFQQGSRPFYDRRPAVRPHATYPQNFLQFSQPVSAFYVSSRKGSISMRLLSLLVALVAAPYFSCGKFLLLLRASSLQACAERS